MIESRWSLPTGRGLEERERRLMSANNIVNLLRNSDRAKVCKIANFSEFPRLLKLANCGDK